MKFPLVVVVQSLNLLAITWFNREAWIRILALRQQLNIYKRKSKKLGAFFQNEPSDSSFEVGESL
jgi:hypothetical protein